MSQPISRVLSRTIIHLGHLSPNASSNLPEPSAGSAFRVPIWSCSRWGLPCHHCYQQCGALLPHHLTLTSTLAVYFLWHLPSTHVAQALPGTLPYGARTFLPNLTVRAIAQLARCAFYTPATTGNSIAVIYLTPIFVGTVGFSSYL